MEKEHKTTSIRFPIWKIIHRFLAENIFVRAKYGRMVNKLEMMLMMKIEEGVKIDWLWCITQGLLDNHSVSDKNRGLGGGSILTLIAKKLNYTFDDGGAVERIKLDHARMRHMHIPGKGLNWKMSKEEDSEEEDDEEAEMEKVEAEKEGNTGSNGLSSADKKLDMLQQLAENQIQLRPIVNKQEGLVQCHNSLCYYVDEHYKWEEFFWLS